MFPYGHCGKGSFPTSADTYLYCIGYYRIGCDRQIVYYGQCGKGSFPSTDTPNHLYDNTGNLSFILCIIKVSY